MVDGFGSPEVTGADFQLPAVFEKLIQAFDAGRLPFQMKVKINPGKSWRGYNSPPGERPEMQVFKGGGSWPESAASVQFSGMTESFSDAPVKVVLGKTISKEANWNNKPVLRIAYRSDGSAEDEYRTPNNEFDFVVENTNDLDAFKAEIQNNPTSWEVFLRRIDPDILEVMPLVKRDKMFLELEDDRRTPTKREVFDL